MRFDTAFLIFVILSLVCKSIPMHVSCGGTFGPDFISFSILVYRYDRDFITPLSNVKTSLISVHHDVSTPIVEAG